ncbi:hypothetical protein F5876DRAFT_81740 [Lentinula aff. lateritia]|uniref:Uncharacterized protein n=1 Tax=Lentinula aff. lateritia TaxID=2804960 RepID=A0ACC1TL30_9AGAR|nr:hypothetical protein F5876DRAFT_81740 [Lentinula aff. lateritia]
MPDSAISSPGASRSTRSLKRSASAASLPTPPRTNRRRKNRKLRSLKAVEEEAGGEASSDEEQRPERQSKRRKISNVPEDDEEAFWTAGSPTSHNLQKGNVKEADEVGTESDSDTATSFLSRHGQRSSTVGSAPVSPPPSHRRIPAAKIASIAPALQLLPVVEENPSPSGTSPPVTPKSSKTLALRDSPYNPFLASPLDLDDAASTSKSSKMSTGLLQEKPTVTFIFRGVKKEYPNPYYDHAKDKPRSPEPNSLLPPEHKDYTPDLRGTPRALWPRKKKAALLSAPESPSNRASRRKAPVQSVPTLTESDDELDSKGDDEEAVSLRPVRLFGPGGRHPGVTRS